MGYEVTITYYNNGTEERITFCKEVTTLDELKQSFLKRFGNIRDVSNRLLKEKPLVKKITYSATSLTEWTEAIKEQTRWELVVREIK